MTIEEQREQIKNELKIISEEIDILIDVIERLSGKIYKLKHDKNISYEERKKTEFLLALDEDYLLLQRLLNVIQYIYDPNIETVFQTILNITRDDIYAKSPHKLS